MKVLTKSWFCLQCGYIQYWEPVDGSKSLADLREVYPGLPAGYCPSCYGGENIMRERKLSKLDVAQSMNDYSDINPIAPIEVEVASNDILETTKVPVFDDNGRAILEKVGTRYEQVFNSQTGEYIAEPVDIFEPKMREVTAEEFSALELQRNQNLDTLAGAIVKEI